METSIPVSCLVYLFGDMFVEGWALWWRREDLSWRPARPVGREGLSRMILISTFISLAEASQLLLATGQRQDEGLILGNILEVVRDTVWATKPKDSPAIEGYLENQILERVKGRNSVYLIIKDLIPYGFHPWDAILGMVRHDLLQRGYLGKRERAGLWRTSKFVLRVEVEALEREGLAVKEMIESFKAGNSSLYDRLNADVTLAFRTELDRTP